MAPSIDGLAVVHALCLQAGIGNGVLVVGGDDGAEHEAGLLERVTATAVVGVHQRVRAGLDLGDLIVQVVGVGAAGADDVATDQQAGDHQLLHRRSNLGALLGSIGHGHEMALVAHHAADDQAHSRA